MFAMPKKHTYPIQLEEFKMRHLIPFTKDQISIIQTSLEASLKYADSEYISEVDAILKEIKDNTRF